VQRGRRSGAGEQARPRSKHLQGRRRRWRRRLITSSCEVKSAGVVTSNETCTVDDANVNKIASKTEDERNEELLKEYVNVLNESSTEEQES
jgi:hypothetical protein